MMRGTVGVLLLCMVGTSLAIKCYVGTCAGKDCTIETDQCDAGSGYCMKASGKSKDDVYGASKGCSPSGTVGCNSVDTDGGSATTCYCQEELCNAATTARGTTGLMFAAAAVIFAARLAI